MNKKQFLCYIFYFLSDTKSSLSCHTSSRTCENRHTNLANSDRMGKYTNKICGRIAFSRFFYFSAKISAALDGKAHCAVFIFTTQCIKMNSAASQFKQCGFVSETPQRHFRAGSRQKQSRKIGNDFSAFLSVGLFSVRGGEEPLPGSLSICFSDRC